MQARQEQRRVLIRAMQCMLKIMNIMDDSHNCCSHEKKKAEWKRRENCFWDCFLFIATANALKYHDFMLISYAKQFKA